MVVGRVRVVCRSGLRDWGRSDGSREKPAEEVLQLELKRGSYEIRHGNLVDCLRTLHLWARGLHSEELFMSGISGHWASSYQYRAPKLDRVTKTASRAVDLNVVYRLDIPGCFGKIRDVL